MRRKRWDAEARADVERGRVRQSHRLPLGEYDEILSRPLRTLPCSLPQPDALTDAAGIDALADRVDRARSILVGHGFGRDRLSLLAGSTTRLPVSRIDSGDANPDAYFSSSRLGHGAFN
jgi:hypothetical protein